MEELFSESQRRVREEHVSLPYHRPKQRSLDEFLKRRSLVAAVPLRTSADELKEVWKQIEEKEKDAEIFYKSEDESGDEDYCDSSEVNKKNSKASKAQQASNTDGSSSENNKNLINTNEKDKASDSQNNDKSSPLKLNTVDSTVNSVEGSQCDDSAEFSLKLAEKFNKFNSEEDPQHEDSTEFPPKLSDKFARFNSEEGSQREDSAEFSLKLSENDNELNSAKDSQPGDSAEFSLRLSEKCSESNSAEGSQRTDSVEFSLKLSEKRSESISAEGSLHKDSEELSLKLSEKCNELNSAKGSQQEDSSEFSLNLPDSSDANCTESLKTVNPLVTDSSSTSSSGKVDVLTKNVKDETKSKNRSDEKKTTVKENKLAPVFDGQKVDEILVCNSDSEIQGKVVHEGEGHNSGSKKSEEFPKNSKLSEEGKCDENDKQVNDSMPESDPLFSLQLEESQDGLETRGNGGFKGTEEGEGAERNENVSNEKSSAKISKNMRGMAEFESSYDSAPKITLKSNSNDIILLDEPILGMKPGVSELIEKFHKHSSLKNVHKKKQNSVQMNIVTTSKNEDNKISGFLSETLTVAVEEEVATGPKNEKPGAKLSRLQMELREQMAKRRQEEWQKRLLEHKVNEEDVDNEKSDCGALLDDDDDFVPSGTESEDSDLEENDIDLSDKKKKKKSAFVDDEAEEDEEEAEESDDDAKEDEEEDDEDTELSPSEQKVKDLTKNKVIIEDDDYKGDDENEDDDKDKEEDEDDEWMQPGQTKMRSQFSPCVSTDNLTSKVDDIGLDDTKFGASFDLNKFGNYSDELDCNKTSNYEISGIEKLINVKNSENTTESQVLELCSGRFQTQPPQIEDEDDNFVLSPSQEKSQSQNIMAKNADPLLSSDDEDEVELSVPRKKKAVLKFSDDEEETNDLKEEDFDKESNVESENEVLEENDDLNADDDLLKENEEDSDNQSVMYDSEENEVIVTKKDVGQFFDKEAELSESDWDSEDEDEKGLDRMDEELGDREQIDEDEVQKELGKIHMRNLLDDDQRDIKLLQERFLEDGELHSDGKGREKNFRWQNFNDEALDAIWRERRNSDGEEPDEEEEKNDENDQHWQKLRKEREAFLRKKKSKGEDDEDLDEEALREQGLLPSVTPSFTADVKKSIDLDKLEESLPPTSILKTTSVHLYPRKGSFLSRSAQILSRVGPIQGAVSIETNLNQKKTNSRNFVFAVKSPTKEDSEDSQDTNSVNKRKLAPTSPVANKKPKFMEKKGITASNRTSLLAQLSVPVKVSSK